MISTYAGNGTPGFSGDGGAATSAQINGPFNMALDTSDNLFFADGLNHRIRQISSTGTIVTIAGTGMEGFSGDGGPASAANLATPLGVEVDASGTLYIADGTNNRIRTVTAAGIINTISGTGIRPFDVGNGGAAMGAKLSGPGAIAFDAVGNAYIADGANHRVRKVTPAGIISTFVGDVTASSTGDDGLFINATVNFPSSVAIDSAGNIYVAESDGHRVRKINVAGVISTYAGTGIAGFGGDGGPANSAQIRSPWGVSIDAAGNLYIADRGNQRIRRVSPAGTIITVAGTGTAGFSGDGGLATLANLNSPYNATIDAGGSLWIADYNNSRIRRVNAAGIITTVAGTGTPGAAGDGGLATSAQLHGPIDVKFDAAGSAYVSEHVGSRVRKIDTAGVITKIAGTGEPGFSGDRGSAATAQLRSPIGLAFDAASSLYVADYGNNRIRKVTGLNGRLASDLSGDGKSDLLLQSGVNGTLSAYLMNGATVTSSATLLAAGPQWVVTHTGDLNGDGKADLLFRNTSDGSTVGFPMDGLSVTATALLIGGGSPWSITQVGDFNGDGKADILWKHTDGTHAIWLMNGLAIAGGGGILGAGPWQASHIGDFNGDGKTDLLWRNTTDNSAAIWLMDGLTISGGASILGAGSPWQASHVGDFNGDGKADILWRNTTDNGAAIWLMNGFTLTSGAGIIGAGPWLALQVGDLDGDGKADIVWRNAGDGTIVAWLMNGASLSSGTTLLGAGSGWTVAKLADYNGDGKADLTWQNTNGSIAIWLMNGLTLTSGTTITGTGTTRVVP